MKEGVVRGDIYLPEDQCPGKKGKMSSILGMQFESRETHITMELWQSIYMQNVTLAMLIWLPC